jgi:hypothetical protein
MSRFLLATGRRKKEVQDNLGSDRRKAGTVQNFSLRLSVRKITSVACRLSSAGIPQRVRQKNLRNPSPLR